MKYPNLELIEYITDNLAKKICDSIKGVLGKYDKGHIYDLNDKLTPSEHEHDYYKDGISHSDKKKVECCNNKLNDWESGDEMDRG